ncbi:MAG: ATP-binding protein, partial [Myxococcota bacterium]
MNDAAAHAVSLPAARQLYEHVAHAVLLYDLPSGQTLYSNSAWARRVGLIEPGKLDQLANFAGRNEVRTVGGPVVLNVSALPLQGHPDVRLVQESTSAPSSVDPTFRTTFPLGVAWIEPTANRVVQLTDAFIKVWGLPPGRISERADRLRTACAGLVLDATAIDKAWPVDTAGTGRFVDVALTDGRSLRISTVDAASEHRWIVVEDVTKPKQRRQARYRRKLQNQETQRLESLSVLAGGIAYDFNKLILAILRNSTVLREESRLDAEGRLAVEHIRSAAEQASKLSAQMLAFSGRGHMITQRTDLKPILHMVADQDSPLPDQPKIALACSGVPPVVMGDPDQLEQLFSAVVSNAREAGATSISIDWAIETWRTDRLSDLYLGERLVSGTYVVVVVEDDGEGIEEVALKRSFEPFFSTRGPGRGLGLAVSAGIARGHGGTIDIRSTAGRGTTVRILL